MKILVCGSRGLNTPEMNVAFEQEVKKIWANKPDENLVLIHGDCRTSPDVFCEVFVKAYPELSVTHYPVPAQWKIFGKRAGIVRNTYMLTLDPDWVIAVWDGESKGTKHMVGLALASGVPVRYLMEGGKAYGP